MPDLCSRLPSLWNSVAESGLLAGYFVQRPGVLFRSRFADKKTALNGARLLHQS
jgi:hypothetical protein